MKKRLFTKLDYYRCCIIKVWTHPLSAASTCTVRCFIAALLDIPVKLLTQFFLFFIQGCDFVTSSNAGWLPLHLMGLPLRVTFYALVIDVKIRRFVLTPPLIFYASWRATRHCDRTYKTIFSTQGIHLHYWGTSICRVHSRVIYTCIYIRRLLRNLVIAIFRFPTYQSETGAKPMGPRKLHRKRNDMAFVVFLCVSYQ